MTPAESAANRPGRPIIALALAVATWAAAGAVLAFFAWAYDGPLLPLETVARWTWASGGLMVAGAAIIVAREPARRRAALTTAALVLVILAGSSRLWASVRDAGWWFHVRSTLALNRGRYEAIVDRVEKGRGEEVGGGADRDGVRYSVDAGPPVRVAFPIGDGILDNWTGIVYDPSGALRDIQGAAQPGATAAADPLRRLFGGLIVFVRDLGDGYFYCVFT